MVGEEVEVGHHQVEGEGEVHHQMEGVGVGVGHHQVEGEVVGHHQQVVAVEVVVAVNCHRQGVGVGDHQWFLAEVGVGVPKRPQELV